MSLSLLEVQFQGTDRFFRFLDKEETPVNDAFVERDMHTIFFSTHTLFAAGRCAR